MVYEQPRICIRKWYTKNSLGFWDKNRSPSLGQTTRPTDSQQQKKREPAD